MSTPRIAPDRIKLETSGAARHPNFDRPLRIPPASPDESPLKETTESGLAAIQPIAAERPIRHRLRRLELLVIASIVCFGYFVWRTHTQGRAFEETAVKQHQAVGDLAASIARQDEMVANVSKSVQDATKTLMVQIGGLAGDLQTRRNQMDTIQSRLDGLEVTLRNHQRTPPVQTPPVQSVQTPPAEAAPTGWAASPRHPHDHQIQTSIPLPAGALAHQSQGVIDYWMVPRMFTSGERVVKVFPYGVNSIGVKVHDIEDGMDYILTPTGQWTAALEQQ